MVRPVNRLAALTYCQLIKEMIMSLMCPMEGCKQKQGMCGHEKMMLVMIILAVIAGLVVFLK